MTNIEQYKSWQRSDADTLKNLKVQIDIINYLLSLDGYTNSKELSSLNTNYKLKCYRAYSEKTYEELVECGWCIEKYINSLNRIIRNRGNYILELRGVKWRC